MAKPLYEYARAGETIERGIAPGEHRLWTCCTLEAISGVPAGDPGSLQADIRVTCTKGTYIERWPKTSARPWAVAHTSLACAASVSARCRSTMRSTCCRARGARAGRRLATPDACRGADLGAAREWCWTNRTHAVFCMANACGWRLSAMRGRRCAPGARVCAARPDRRGTYDDGLLAPCGLIARAHERRARARTHTKTVTDPLFESSLS